MEDDFIARRDQALLELFYSSGLRLSELVGLDLEWLDLKEGLVRVRGKGNKVRELPVGKAARQALEACRCAPRPLRKTERCSSAAAASA